MWNLMVTSDKYIFEGVGSLWTNIRGSINNFRLFDLVEVVLAWCAKVHFGFGCGGLIHLCCLNRLLNVQDHLFESKQLVVDSLHRLVLLAYHKCHIISGLVSETSKKIVQVKKLPVHSTLDGQIEVVREQALRKVERSQSPSTTWPYSINDRNFGSAQVLNQHWDSRAQSTQELEFSSSAHQPQGSIAAFHELKTLKVCHIESLKVSAWYHCGHRRVWCKKLQAGENE
jgi:hypothetical protein